MVAAVHPAHVKAEGRSTERSEAKAKMKAAPPILKELIPSQRKDVFSNSDFSTTG